MKEENDKKAAKKFAKILEATVAATDVSGKAAEAKLALDAMNNPAHYEQVYENKKTVTTSPSDLAQKKADGITSQIEAAKSFHDAENQKKTDDFIKKEKTSFDPTITDNSKVKQLKDNPMDNPKKTLDKFKKNKADISDKGTSKTDTSPESKTAEFQKKLDKFNQNKEDITDKKNPKTDDFKENKTDLLNKKDTKTDAFTENKNDITNKKW